MANILVLDDVQDAGILIQRILSRKGHTVHAFTEEEECIEFVKKNPVDLIILDMKLKKMSGMDVLEELMNISSDIKVMMLTGYPTLETARESLNLGAVEYCVKPIDKDELETKVAEMLGED
jgi:DNA-binding NtrC family response regulator